MSELGKETDKPGLKQFTPRKVEGYAAQEACATRLDND